MPRKVICTNFYMPSRRAIFCMCAFFYKTLRVELNPQVFETPAVIKRMVHMETNDRFHCKKSIIQIIQPSKEIIFMLVGISHNVSPFCTKINKTRRAYQQYQECKIVQGKKSCQKLIWETSTCVTELTKPNWAPLSHFLHTLLKL